MSPGSKRKGLASLACGSWEMKRHPAQEGDQQAFLLTDSSGGGGGAYRIDLLGGLLREWASQTPIRVLLKD